MVFLSKLNWLAPVDGRVISAYTHKYSVITLLFFQLELTPPTRTKLLRVL